MYSAVHQAQVCLSPVFTSSNNIIPINLPKLKY